MSDRFVRLFRTPNGAALPRFAESLAHGSISEHVAGQILTLIKGGHLKARDRLPTESQMTLALGISRPPLREALKALTLMGVLESRQGGRYTVTDLSPLRLMEPFNVLLSGRSYDATHHYEARGVVELDCVRLCAERAGSDLLARISKLAVDGPATIGDVMAFRVVDRQFHGAIYAGAGNGFLEAVANGLFSVGLDIRRGATLLPGMMARSCEDHRRIAEALSMRDAERAAMAYSDHLLHIRDTTLRMIGAGEAADGASA